jgi:tetratricopeptide (TPR) repeat protein
MMIFPFTSFHAQEPRKQLNSTQVYEQRIKILLQEGMNACSQGSYERAVLNFQQLLATEPEPKAPLKAYTHHWLAVAYFNLRDSIAALESLRSAAALGYTEWQEIESLLSYSTLASSQQAKEILATMKQNATVKKVYDVAVWNNPDIPSQVLFTFGDYESPSYRKLRSKYPLTQLIKDGKTEFEQHRSVMNWVHNLWQHSSYGIAKQCSALAILDEMKRPNFTGFRCIEYCVVLCEVLQALGFPARTVEIGRDGVSYGIGKSHFVVEVWNNDLRKWVLLDPQNNVVWIDQSSQMPLNANEIRERWIKATNDSALIAPQLPSLHCIVGESLWQRTAFNSTEWLKYFYHLFYPLDNRSFIASLEKLSKINLLAPDQKPELAYQQRVQDLQITRRINQVYPALNRVHIDIKSVAGKTSTKTSHTLEAVFTTSMPWFDHYSIECNGVTVNQKNNTYSWKLAAGSNTLVVQGVNKAGIASAHSRIVLTYYAQK